MSLNTCGIAETIGPSEGSEPCLVTSSFPPFARDGSAERLDRFGGATKTRHTVAARDAAVLFLNWLVAWACGRPYLLPTRSGQESAIFSPIGRLLRRDA